MAISNDKKKVKAYIQRELVLRELARRYFKYYIQYIYPKYDFTPFHDAYIKILQAFIDGKIKKLMLSVPPPAWQKFISVPPFTRVPFWPDPGG